MTAKKSKFKRNWSAVNDRILSRNKKFKDDDRIYKIKYDTSTHTSKVVMRFLPPISEDAMPYSQQDKHFFQDTGGWFIEPCPTTIGGNCPVCDHLRKADLYNVDNPLYFDRKKQVIFYTNVLIIDDSVTPSNNGKVFIYKFGKKIMDKIEDSIDDGLEAWDVYEGVNFTMSAKKKNASAMGSYDASRFSDKPTSLEEYGDIDDIMAMRHNIEDFENEDNYKSYDELKERYLKVIGETDGASDEAPKRTRVTEESQQESVEDVKPEPTSTIGDMNMFDDDDDDDDDFFGALAD